MDGRSSAYGYGREDKILDSRRSCIPRQAWQASGNVGVRRRVAGDQIEMAKQMTKHGYDKIIAEINRLWTEERPEVVEECYQAALLGDRSENAAYIYGKQRLRRIDSRLQFLRGKIKEVQVVNTDFLPQRPDIQFGALVFMEDEEGSEHIIRLVDQNESAPKEGRISVQSPIGKALIGLQAGDNAEVQLPKGVVEYEITKVHYGQDPRAS